MKLNLTDVLDLAGSLLLVAALAVFVAAHSLAGALAVAGVGLLAVSFLIDHPLPELARTARLRRARRKGASS